MHKMLRDNRSAPQTTDANFIAGPVNAAPMAAQAARLEVSARYLNLEIKETRSSAADQVGSHRVAVQFDEIRCALVRRLIAGDPDSLPPDREEAGRAGHWQLCLNNAERRVDFPQEVRAVKPRVYNF
jgi:hypothetical protein